MSEVTFRIVFDKIDKKADLRTLSPILKEKFGLSDQIIEGMLAGPPRVLKEGLARSNAKKMQTDLRKIGCVTDFEPTLTDHSFPFSISQKHHRLIDKEFRKNVKSNEGFSLFLIHVASTGSGTVFPSMMGTFENELPQHFRESDSFFGIDDRRVIILSSLTGKDKVNRFTEKAKDVFGELLGTDASISVGYASFPEEGDDLSSLIKAAESSRKEDQKTTESEKKAAATPMVLARDKGTITPIQVCFTEARGKIFRRLLEMDPKTLLLGLSQLPPEKQREFLARLPFDSPLLPILEQAMASQSGPIQDKVAEEDLSTIIYYMELDEGLEERRKNQDAILSKMNRIEALPTLPSIASRVLMIASNPDSSASELTDVIVNDPSLTSTLLKIVNSAFYGFPQKIGTVKQAVVLLGTGEIVALSFGLSTAKLFASAHLKGVYSPKDLWRHSMCTGLIAESLCKRFPEYRKLGVFTAGLLHDFGKIILIDHFPELYGQVHVDVKKYELPLYDLEDERFGLNHAIIGEFLATNWKLPAPLTQAIAFHHQPAAATSHPQLAAIIGLADYLYYEVAALGELPNELRSFPCELTSSHWAFLGQVFPGLNSEQLKQMTQDALQVIRNSHDLFSILD